MSDVKFKFKVTCYLQGYGSWDIIVNNGSWKLTDRVYTVIVSSGIIGRNDKKILAKTYRFPAELTIIEENK